MNKNLKRSLYLILALAVMVAMMLCGTIIASAEESNAVAKIGNTEYATLQAAVDAAKSGETVVLLVDCDENVVVNNSADFTIDGGKKIYKGSITVNCDHVEADHDGKLIIKYFNFASKADKMIYIKAATNTNEATHEIDITDCTFAGAGSNYAIYSENPEKLVIYNCTATSVFSLLENKLGGEEIVVTNCKVDVGHGIDFEHCLKTYVENFEYTGNYAAIHGCHTNGELTLKNVNVKCGTPTAVILEKCVHTSAGAKFTVNLEGTNTFKTTTEGRWIGGAAANIGNVYYASLADAIADAQANQTITFVNNITEDVTISKAVTIDGAGFTYTGKMTVTGAVDQTVQNVNFVKGSIDGNTSAQGRSLTVNNCTFDGVDKSIGYAITVRHGDSLIITDTTATNYSTGMLYVPQNVVSIVAKNVTVSNVTAAFNITYSGNALFENVAFENVNFGIHFQIHGSRTYTVKNSDLSGATNPFWFWNIEGKDVKVTIRFEGDNVVPTFQEKAYTTAGILTLAADATLTAPEGITVTTVEGYEVKYENGVYTSVVKPSDVVAIGTQGYASLTGAIAAAQAGDTITFLADVAENVTISKSITIDGAGKTFSGEIDLTNKANVTIKNVNFDGKGAKSGVYAVESKGAYYVTIEYCTAKNYMGLLQVASGAVLTTVKNVTVSNMGYGVKVDYSNAFVIENADINASVAAVLNSNYGEKTITVKNSKLNILGTWTRNNTLKTTYVFEGANTIDEFIIDAAIDNFKLAEGATLTAPNDITVTTDVKGGLVLYEDGKYFVKMGLKGSGTEADPYQIGSVDDFIMFRDSVNAGEGKYNNAYVILTADIDLSSVANWTPIGNVDYNSKYAPADTTKVFSGVFDGNGKVISNLAMTKIMNGGADAEANLGLFGITGEGAVIKNLTITNVNINTDGRNVGALVAFAYKATIDNITVNGDIQIKGGNNVSGVCAMSRYNAVSITNITVSGNDGSEIVGNNIVGGIFAEIAPNGTEQTFKNLNIENVAITGAGGVGGIVGLLTTGAVDTVSVKNVVLTGRTDYQGDAMGRIRLGSVAGLMGGKYAIIANATVENVAAKNLDGNTVSLPIIGANYDASSNETEAKIGDTYYATIAEALKKSKAGDTITLLVPYVIKDGETVTLDLTGVTVYGSILAPNANLTIKGGKIVNTDNSVSAIEINGGTLVLENVEVDSARHALRIDGAVTVTINGGVYRSAIGSAKGTYHALNVSGNAVVTIENSTFVGPKGTAADSGAAVNVKSGATVYINGGNFSGGKNNTLSNSGVLVVTGGTFDQDPSAFITAKYRVKNNNGVYTVERKPSGEVDYRADVTDKADREGIAITMKDVYATTSLVVKVYHDNTLMFTSTRRDIDDEDKVMFPVDGRTTANIVIWGRESGSWINEILVTPNQNNVPNKIEVWADDELVDTYTNDAGTVLGTNLEKYLALDCVEKIVNVAQIGTQGYASLAEAVNAAKDGDVIVIVSDFVLEYTGAKIDGLPVLVAVDGKKITIDLNGHTISATSGSKNLDYYAAFAAGNGGNLTLEDSVGTGSVVVTGSYTMYSLLMAYGDGDKLTVNGGSYYLENAHDNLIYAGGHTSDMVFIYGGNFELENVGAGENGKPWIFNVLGAADNHVNVYGGTFNFDINRQHWSNEVYVAKECYTVNNGDGTYTVKPGAVAYVNVGMLSGPHFTPKNIGFATLEEAFAAADDDRTVTLLQDVTIDTALVNTYKVTLDLNGKTITGTDNATVSFGLITNKGTLTITGNGKITLTATNDRGWSAYSSVISNQPGGKLIVESGTIEHLGGTAMAYGIDNLTNGKGTYAETIINGGLIKSTYRAIRMFLNGVEAQNILTINGGTVEGANKSVWMQDPSKNANTGKLTVTEGATLNGDVYLSVTAGSTEYPVEVSIAASAVNGEVLTSNFPAGYVLEKKGGNWGVNEYYFKVGNKYYDTLEAAVKAANQYQTVQILQDAEGPGLVINKKITIDFGGFTYTITDPVGSKGTESNGFQILAGNYTVRLLNGTLRVADDVADKFYILVQNYADLIIQKMVLDGTNLDKWALTDGDSYTLSNNSGHVQINVSTIIANNDGDKAFAFDVCDMSKYYELPVVTVYPTSKIQGKIEAVAKVGSKYYATLEQAINAAQEGASVTLLAPVVVNAGETLNLNKKVTINYTSNVPGEDMITNRGTLIIDGITLVYVNKDTTASNVTVSTISCEPGSVLEVKSGTVKNNSANRAASGIYAYAIDLVTNGALGDVTATISGGKVISTNYMAIRQFVNGNVCKNTLNVTGGTIEGGTRGINIQLKNNMAYTNISGGVIKGGDYSICFITTSENVSVTGGDFYGEVWYSGTNGFITGGSFDTAIDLAYVVDGYKLSQNDGIYTVIVDEFYDSVASIGDNKYATFADAWAAVQNGETIVLQNNITIDTATFTVADGKKITLDLSGYTITVTDNANSNYELFYIYGEMIVTGDGTIELTSTNNRAWNAMSAIFHNRGGVLTIENGTFKNLGGTDMAWVVDNSGNWYGDATTVINGGTLTSTYTAIRNRMEQNTHGASGKAILVINGGTIDGTTSAIWAQAASTSTVAPATGSITVNGGNIGVINTARSDGAISMTTINGGTVAAFKGESGELTVNGGKITGDIIIMFADGEVAVKNIVKSNVYYGAVAQMGSKYYATLADAVKACTGVQSINLLRDVEGPGIVITKKVTINFAGFTYTVTAPAADNVGFKITTTAAVRLINGTITAAEDAGIDVLVEHNGTGKLTVQHQALVVANNETGLVVNGGSVDLNYATIKADGAVAFEINGSAVLTLYTSSSKLTGTINAKKSTGYKYVAK